MSLGPGTLSPFILVLTLAACAPSHERQEDAAGENEEREMTHLLAKPEAIDYASVARYVLAKNCVSCHNAEKRENGIDLSTYDALLNGNGERALLRPADPEGSTLFAVLKVSGKRHMPPLDRPQLKPAHLELVRAWIVAGAREDDQSAALTAPSLTEELTPYFDRPEEIDYTVVRRVGLSESCMKCHSLNGASADRQAIAYSANMTDYAALFNPFTPIVTKGRPEESKLFRAVAITQSMPPKRLGYLPWDGLRLKLLRLWILNCAIEDKAALGDEIFVRDLKNPDKVRTCL